MRTRNAVAQRFEAQEAELLPGLHSAKLFV
jgi:hypothetical protein